MSKFNPDPGKAEFHEAGELTSRDFASFFEDVHGYKPFPWQQRLTAHVLDQKTWPKVIDLPTGTGKTAVLDTALFTMAARPATSPRRIVFVIDRRIVVDQVHKRAMHIRERIEQGSTPILKQVQERLLGLANGKSLGIAALRGGIPVDSEWTQYPDQPWVLVSTVDQFGSRLLFRGYGVNQGMRPIHAGLAGNDCLVILDEVHLSTPFAETLTQISKLQSAVLPRRFAIVEMSATPNNKDTEPFTLDPVADLEECEELRRRVQAVKQAQLKSVKDQNAIPSAVLKIVKSMDKSIRSVGIIVNRVRTARATHEALSKEKYSSHLITGRMRPLDRIDALNRIYPLIDPDQAQRNDNLSIVVATQAIEVGADFSFDALITECAAGDSLRQRFGRLDRRGRCFDHSGRSAQAWIIGLKSVISSKKPDPVYGDSVRTTWEALTSRAQNGLLDVSPTSLRDLPDNTTAPKAQAPLILKTHMNAWVQTRPEPIVQPPIEWFLHGIDQNHSADVSILWRWDLSPEALRLVPPRQAEFVQVPIAAVRAWLAKFPEVDIADVAQAQELEDSPFQRTSHSREYVRWSGVANGVEHVEIKNIRPGDVLILNPEQGGLSAGTWDPLSEAPVEDLGDAAQVEYGRRATLRLDPRLPHIDSPPTPADEAEAATPVSVRVADWLTAQTDKQSGRFSSLQKIIERLKDNFEIIPVGAGGENSGNGYYVLTERHRETKKPVVDAGAMDGSDETGSLTGTSIPLERHLEGVSKRAASTAKHLGFSPAIAEDLKLAGRLHDLGKVDQRFQLQLVGGDPVAQEMHRDKPLAKSLPGVRRVQKYPRGMRHEIASVAMIKSNSDILGLAHDKDLVLHLVGSHHGWARPFLPIIEDPDPQALSCTLGNHCMQANSNQVESSLALDMADRFWRLVQRYGYHGLAWLEAVLRLSDHQQSAEEAKQA